MASHGLMRQEPLKLRFLCTTKPRLLPPPLLVKVPEKVPEKVLEKEKAETASHLLDVSLPKIAKVKTKSAPPPTSTRSMRPTPTTTPTSTPLLKVSSHSPSASPRRNVTPLSRTPPLRISHTPSLSHAEPASLLPHSPPSLSPHTSESDDPGPAPPSSGLSLALGVSLCGP